MVAAMHKLSSLWLCVLVVLTKNITIASDSMGRTRPFVLRNIDKLSVESRLREL